jgi:hypothetical protein
MPERGEKQVELSTDQLWQLRQRLLRLAKQELADVAAKFHGLDYEDFRKFARGLHLPKIEEIFHQVVDVVEAILREKSTTPTNLGLSSPR